MSETGKQLIYNRIYLCNWFVITKSEGIFLTILKEVLKAVLRDRIYFLFYLHPCYGISTQDRSCGFNVYVA